MVSYMIYRIEMFSVYVWRFVCCWFDERWVGECSSPIL